MTSLAKLSRNHIFYTIFLIIFSTNLAVFLDIPIIRSVLGVIFLTILPGLSLVLILKLEKLSFLEKSLIAIGLSITFIMIFGLFINILLPLFGIEKPLSIFNIIISFTIILLIFFIIAYIKNKNTFHFEFTSLSNIDYRSKILLLLSLLLLFISVLGIHIMNTTNTNIFLMFFYFLVVIYVILVSLFHDKIPDKIYPIIILLLAIALQLVFALRSNHILGSDGHAEYYIFQQTFNNGQWQILGYINILDSCLSISILPTVYQSFLNINSEYLFKLLYPLIFSITPIIVYLISRRFIENPYAFLASMFFMSQTYFLFSGLGPRTIIGILFFALAIGVLFFDKLNNFHRNLFFILFTISCIISHYSTTYIFFFTLLFTWIGFLIFRWINQSGKKTFFSKNEAIERKNTTLTNKDYISKSSSSMEKGHITLSILVLFFILLFFWYSQVVGSVFDTGVNFVVTTFNNLQDFFILESRGSNMENAFGLTLDQYGIPHLIRFIFSWLTIIFIAVGVTAILFRFRQKVNFTNEGEGHVNEFLSRKIDGNFFVLSLSCSAILAIAVIVPFVFVGYDMLRTYLQMMIILSLFFVIGGIVFSKFLHFKRTYLIVTIVLILFFMSNNGTIYQIYGIPKEITLNSEGHLYDMYYIHEHDSVSAKWLTNHIKNDANIYSDWVGRGKLTSQGMIPNPLFMNLIEPDKPLVSGYIYLSYAAIVKHKLVSRGFLWHNFTDYEKKFDILTMIYSNGGSAVYV
jgi:uncharacterized membrane protein